MSSRRHEDRREKFFRSDEGVAVKYHPASSRDCMVGGLESPWVGDEGPLDADFRQVSEISTLRPRGLAFDNARTIYWDEDAVVEVAKTESRRGELAYVSPVLLRKRFQVDGEGEGALYRIDVLSQGALLGSRYSTKKPVEWREDAKAQRVP